VGADEWPGGDPWVALVPRLLALDGFQLSSQVFALFYLSIYGRVPPFGKGLSILSTSLVGGRDAVEGVEPAVGLSIKGALLFPLPPVRA